MPRPNRMAEIEREYGEPLKELIPRKLNEFGSMEAAAPHLGISFRRLYQWCKENGVVRHVEYVVVEGDAHAN